MRKILSVLSILTAICLVLMLHLDAQGVGKSVPIEKTVAKTLEKGERENHTTEPPRY